MKQLCAAINERRRHKQVEGLKHRNVNDQELAMRNVTCMATRRMSNMHEIAVGQGGSLCHLAGLFLINRYLIGISLERQCRINNMFHSLADRQQICAAFGSKYVSLWYSMLKSIEGGEGTYMLV